MVPHDSRYFALIWWKAVESGSLENWFSKIPFLLLFLFPAFDQKCTLHKLIPCMPAPLSKYNKTQAIYLQGLVAWWGERHLWALVTSYFRPLIAVVLIMSHSPLLQPPFPEPRAKAGDGSHVFVEWRGAPLCSWSRQRSHRQVSGARASGLGVSWAWGRTGTTKGPEREGVFARASVYFFSCCTPAIFLCSMWRREALLCLGLCV